MGWGRFGCGGVGLGVVGGVLGWGRVGRVW